MRRVFSRSEGGYDPELLIGVFRLRSLVFKERLNWKVSSRNGIERDEFDELDPVYFAASNGQGEVDGTWRLLPTTGPTMLSQVFPLLLGERPAPKSPFVWEMSRLALQSVARDDTGDAVDHTRCTIAVLFGAAMEFCWQNGIRELVVVHDRRMARITRRTLGYPATWETRTSDIYGVPTSAAQYRVDSPTAFRRRAGLPHDVLSLDDIPSIESVA